MGLQWSQFTAFEIQGPNGPVGTGQFTYDFKAAGPEQVTTTAGAFTAMRVAVTGKAEYTVSGKTLAFTLDATEWWAPAVGRVKSSGTLGAPASTSYEIDLVSYQIP